MAALTQARTVPVLAVQNSVRNSIAAPASTRIWAGAFIGKTAAGTTGRALVAGDKFLGLCLETVDNRDGGAGDLDIPYTTDMQIEHAVTGAASAADVGKPVYASDDNTLTLTATNNSLMGVIERWVSSTTCIIRVFGQKEIVLS